MQNVTTSIRLPSKLREQLEKTSRKLHRGKNWIITKALEEYLAKTGHEDLAKEARRQSLLVARLDKEADKDWEENTDTSGWI